MGTCSQYTCLTVTLGSWHATRYVSLFNALPCPFLLLLYCSFLLFTLADIVHFSSGYGKCPCSLRCSLGSSARCVSHTLGGPTPGPAQSIKSCSCTSLRPQLEMPLPLTPRGIRVGPSGSCRDCSLPRSVSPVTPAKSPSTGPMMDARVLGTGMWTPLRGGCCSAWCSWNAEVCACTEAVESSV